MQNVSSSNSQAVNVPKLRFPGFEEEWKEEKLSDFTERVTRKNKNNETELPLTISSKDGLVDQITYFNKQVSSKDMSGYYLLKNGEFAYNKSYSVGYDFGSIKRLDRYSMGALSTLYICFALTKHNSDFIKTYFDSLKWYKDIYLIAAEGARNHGLLNVPTEDFFSTKHFIPQSEKEQKKIAEFLVLLDKRIQKQEQLVESLKLYKRGVLKKQIEFYQQTKFAVNEIVDEYVEKVDSSSTLPILSSTMSGIFLQEMYFNKQAASEDISGYKAVPHGYFTYRSMSDTGKFRFNIQTLVDCGIVSPAYPVFKVKNNNPRYVEYILNESDYIRNQLLILKEGGTRYALSYTKFLNLNILLPSVEIQNKIAKQIDLFDELIMRYESVLNKLFNFKSSLLQQMFI